MLSNISRINFNDSPKIFWEQYLLFLDNFECISPLYFESTYTYSKEYFCSNSINSSNISFLLKENDIVFFAFIGLLFHYEKKDRLSFFEKPCISINLEKLSKNQKKKISENIENILLEFKGQFIINDYYYGSKFSYLSEYLFFKYNCQISTNFKKIINLEDDVSILKSNIRKSYKSLINNGLRELKIELFNSENIKKRLIDDFKLLHINEAKRQTRNDATWDSQYEAIKKNDAFMIAGFRDNEMISAGYFLLSKTDCYYGSSASRRDLFDKPLFHSLMWSSILFAKDIGIKSFDLGNVYITHTT